MNDRRFAERTHPPSRRLRGNGFPQYRVGPSQLLLDLRATPPEAREPQNVAAISQRHDKLNGDKRSECVSERARLRAVCALQPHKVAAVYRPWAGAVWPFIPSVGRIR